MSGYHAHELCFTRFDERPSAVLRRARAYLERAHSLVENPAWGTLLRIEGQGPGEYLREESYFPTTDEEVDEPIAMGLGLLIDQKIKLGAAHYQTMLIVLPGTRVGFVWKIESAVFDEMYEWKGWGDGWNPTMKSHLVEYVFGLAYACRPEGFVLKRDKDELRTYSVSEIKETWLGYINGHPLTGASMRGLDRRRLSLREVEQKLSKGRRSKYDYTVFDTYTVQDFLWDQRGH